MAEGIRVSVVLALRREQPVVEFTVAPGTTASEALRLAGLCRDWPSDGLRLGIFGRLVADDRILRAGDRVEVLRPLVNDPKEVRRLRAAVTANRRSTRRR